MYKSDLEAAITGREVEKARADKAEAGWKSLREGKSPDNSIGTKRNSWPKTYFIAVFFGLFLSDIISLAIFGSSVVIPELGEYLGKTIVLVIIAFLLVCVVPKNRLVRTEKIAILLAACSTPLVKYLVYLFFVR